MKKTFFFFLLLAMIASYTPAKAFLVTIPDANFRAKLQTLYPTCFVGAQLETTCASVTSAILLNVSSSNIANLSGVEHFINLQRLECNNNQLTSLPALPANLQYLDCSVNQLTSLQAMPYSLQYLYCYQNQLTSLPVFTFLPASLLELYCHDNQILGIGNLPSSLLKLSCYANKLSILQQLPYGLQLLWCNNNRITSFQGFFPVTVQDLRCYTNLLDFAKLEAFTFRPTLYNATPQSYTISPAVQTVVIGTTLTIIGTIGGSLNLYQWYKNNVPISGANSATYTKPSITIADAGTYKCVVTSAYVGAGTTAGVTITSSNVIVSVACPTFTITPAPTSFALSYTVASAIAPIQMIASSPGTYVYSATDLPIGITITATGFISGVPTTPTTLSSFTVTATNGVCTSVAVYSFVVTCPPIIVNPNSLANTTVGATYSQNLTQVGLTGTPTWSITAGTLPAGLNFAITGIISGNATTVGTFNFTVTATNGVCSQTKAYTIVVACPIITITPAPTTLNYTFRFVKK